MDLLLPAGCVACRDWIPGGRRAPLVCARCTSLLRGAPWPRCPRCHHPRVRRPGGEAADCPECAAWPAALTGARYAYVLRPPADDLVHALKYEGWRELASTMGDAMAKLARRELSRTGPPDLVVPVPTTAERLASRGYNQAALLAAPVAEALGLRLMPALERAGSRASQTSLTPSERRENVRGVFAPASGSEGSVRGARVLLVDDVLTTGATASEAAEALRAMGAGSVLLLTYARALATAPGNGR